MKRNTDQAKKPPATAPSVNQDVMQLWLFAMGTKDLSLVICDVVVFGTVLSAGGLILQHWPSDVAAIHHQQECIDISC